VNLSPGTAGVPQPIHARPFQSGATRSSAAPSRTSKPVVRLGVAVRLGFLQFAQAVMVSTNTVVAWSVRRRRSWALPDRGARIGLLPCTAVD
jgi:hypothetical protein